MLLDTKQSLSDITTVLNSPIEKRYGNFKSHYIKEFRNLMKVFFTEVNAFKNELVRSHIANDLVTNLKRLIEELLKRIIFLKDEIKDKNELIKSLLMKLLKPEDAVLSNKNKKPPRKLEEFQQDFNYH